MQTLRLFLAFAVLTVLFASCRKSIDSSADAISTSVQNDASDPAAMGCKIRRIYQDVGGQVQTAVFSFNRAGNPYSVLYSNNGTGNRNHFFVYDSKNRLREWRQQYGEFIVEHHKYGYNSSNQIVVDSMLSREAGAHYETISTLEYDPSGRVIKETIVNTYADGNPLEPTRRPTYTYDARGNIGVLGWKSSSYDYKINPLRTNTVFQFVMRNYSKNNPADQGSYNAAGLPLKLHPSNDIFFNSSVTYRIIYECP